MAKVHFFSIPDQVFAEIITRSDLEYLDFLTRLYRWSHFHGHKVMIHPHSPDNLIEQMQRHGLAYRHQQIDPTV